MVSVPKDPSDQVRCPICRKSFDPRQSPARPFCSDRCRLIDLGRWLGEEYHVPDDEADDEPADEPV
jgi:endogenous inhibitor of DNA gyrase (YacG/DUF329 family)